MIFVKCMDLYELKRYAIDLEMQCEGVGTSVLSVSSDEILSYFKVWQNDKFLCIRFKGNKASLSEELSYIKLPKRTYGRFIVYKGNCESTIAEFVEVQMAIGDVFSDEECDPLLGWIGNSDENCIEFELITKIYDKSDISNKMVFNSLFEVLIHDMNIEKDKSLCASLEKAPKKITGNKIVINMQGMTRSSFLMSLKKEQFEKNIYEYTGKKIKLQIV